VRSVFADDFLFDCRQTYHWIGDAGFAMRVALDRWLAGDEQVEKVRFAMQAVLD
jgi:hypothetical protein